MAGETNGIFKTKKEASTVLGSVVQHLGSDKALKK